MINDYLKEQGLDPNDFEVVHEPLIREGETPCQWLARMYPSYDWSSAETLTWDHVNTDANISHCFMRLISLDTKPRIFLQKKK